MSALYVRVAVVATAIGALVIAPRAAASKGAGEHAATITINGTRPGPVFDGVGAITGGGLARLLIDYPEPERGQILDYLFKPRYGADVQLLKLEIGGDAESTDAAEPSIEHARGHVNCNAGYQMWLAKQAKRLDPRIKFYALQWSAPGWVGHGKQNPWTQTDISYLMQWMNCAKRAGLTINYLGGWNEHLPTGKISPVIIDWFVSLRAALNAHGYASTKVVAGEGSRSIPDIADYLADHPAFRRAIAVLGYHNICGYPTAGRVCRVPSAATASGKAVWASEIGRLGTPDGAAALARTIDNAFNQAKAAAVIEYPLLTAMPGGMVEENTGLVYASQPWSGHYQVSLLSWVIAQTTQFTRPGWVHVRGAAGQFGGSYGSYTAYMGPRRKAWSLVAQTSGAPAPQRVTVHVTGGLPSRVVHVWATKLDPSSPAGWFIRRRDIRPAAGTFTTTLRPGYVYSFTSTSGPGKCGFGDIGEGSACPTAPAATPMPLPYSTTPSGTTWPQQAYGPDAAREPWGLEPVDGSFEYPSAHSPYFVQTTASRPDFWQPLRKLARFPYAVVGDYCLGDLPVNPGGTVPIYCGPSPAANYTVSATVTFTKAGQSAGLIARYDRPVITPIQYFQGYRFTVSESGQWRLLRDSPAKVAPTVISSGILATTPLGTNRPITLSLTVTGPTLTASIEGTQVASKSDATWAAGIAGICTSGWYPVRFADVTVTGVGS